MQPILALAAILSSTVLRPDPSSILQTSRVFSWTVPALAGWNMLPVRDGVPLTASGIQPLPGWGSFGAVTLRSPLEAGVWGGGGWELDFASLNVPDSSFESGMGLIQNTEDMNRYSADLRRPLTSMFDLDLSIARDDTLNDQRLVVRTGPFETGARGWRRDEDLYALWSSWRFSGGMTRATFAHLRSDGRYWEAAAAWQPRLEALDARAAGSVSLRDDSIAVAKLHSRLESSIMGLRAVIRGDLEYDDGDLRPGGTAGILTEVRGFRLQAGIAAVAGDDPRLLGTAGAGPADLMVEAGKDGFQGGLQALIRTDYGFAYAGAAALKDTLRLGGTLMPSLPWGAEGRFHGGASWEMTRSPNGYAGTLDLVSMFTLGRFAFIFAVEDMTDELRSYSFGITWAFTDHPPRAAVSEERD